MIGFNYNYINYIVNHIHNIENKNINYKR